MFESMFGPSPLQPNMLANMRLKIHSRFPGQARKASFTGQVVFFNREMEKSKELESIMGGKRAPQFSI